MKKFILKKRLAAVIILCIGLIGAHYAGLTRYSERYLLNVLAMVEKNFSFAGESIAEWMSVYLTRNDLAAMNEKLRAKVIELARENSQLYVFKEENHILKKEINFIDEYKYKFVVARVLGRSLNYESMDILIDKGLEAKVYDGMAVTTEGGVIIGKIIKSAWGQSHIRLLIDNQSRLAVSVAGEEASLGVAHGENNLNIKIDMLSKESKIEIGDFVSTSGLEENIPQGLLLGEISKVNFAEEALWQTAIVSPAVDYSRVRLVFVLIAAEREL